MDVFNPFNKPFEKVSEEDLQKLKEINEGWYVEYKRETPAGKKIAKSISSFANSHGGLYFLGIEADKDNFAENIEGVADSPDILRNSVYGNVNPFPYFESFVIKLKNNKHVIMAVVEESNNPPHIHNDGRIYRRNEGASDPIPESDRHTIDKLYEKTLKYNEIIEGYRKFDYTFCQAEEAPVIEVFMNTKPFGQFFINDLILEENLSKIRNFFGNKFSFKNQENNAEIINGNIVFDTINTCYGGVCIRQMNKKPTLNGITFEIDVHGNGRFFFPLRTTEIPDYIELEENQGSEKIKEILGEDFFYIKFVKTRDLLGASLGLTQIYAKFLKNKGYTGKIEMKIRLKNCWRTSLNFSNKSFLEYIKSYGLPVCMKNEQYFPRYPIELDVNTLSSEKFESLIDTLSKVFSPIALAFGTHPATAIKILMEDIKTKDQKS